MSLPVCLYKPLTNYYSGVNIHSNQVLLQPLLRCTAMCGGAEQRYTSSSNWNKEHRTFTQGRKRQESDNGKGGSRNSPESNRIERE